MRDPEHPLEGIEIPDLAGKVSGQVLGRMLDDLFAHLTPKNRAEAKRETMDSVRSDESTVKFGSGRNTSYYYDAQYVIHHYLGYTYPFMLGFVRDFLGDDSWKPSSSLSNMLQNALTPITSPAAMSSSRPTVESSPASSVAVISPAQRSKEIMMNNSSDSLKVPTADKSSSKEEIVTSNVATVGGISRSYVSCSICGEELPYNDHRGHTCVPFLMQKIEQLEERNAEFEKRIAKLEKRIAKFEKRIAKLEHFVSILDKNCAIGG